MPPKKSAKTAAAKAPAKAPAKAAKPSPKKAEAETKRGRKRAPEEEENEDATSSAHAENEGASSSSSSSSSGPVTDPPAAPIIPLIERKPVPELPSEPQLWRKLETRGDYSGVNFKDEIVLQGVMEEKAGPCVEIVLPRKATTLSVLISEFLQEHPEGEQVVIPLKNKFMDEPTLESIAVYLTHYFHANTEPFVADKPCKRHLQLTTPAWEFHFIYRRLFKDGIEKEHKQLMHTVNAATFLNIVPLRDLCCAAIACMFYGKDEKQIRELFGVKREYTKADYDRVDRDFPWIKEMIAKNTKL